MRLAVDVFPCEDGHAQERSLLSAVLLTVVPSDVWIADRNFHREFTCGIDDRDACCLFREHKKFPWQALEDERYIGKSETGAVYEQRIRVVDQSGKEHEFRRIRIQLEKETRNGDWEISIITNVPLQAADGIKIAELYQEGWTIETAFQELATFLNSEINTLGYMHRAALFGFCVALIAYMVLSVIRAAGDSAHGQGTAEKVSGYYIADEISATYRGMMIAIPDESWDVCSGN